MLVPERPAPMLTDGVCASCRRRPDHPDILAALERGREWVVVDLGHLGVPPFYRCPVCEHELAHQAHDDSIAAGWPRPPLACCAVA